MGTPWGWWKWGGPRAAQGGSGWMSQGGWKQPILPQPCVSTGRWGSRASALISPFARPLQGLMQPTRHIPAPLGALASRGGGFILPES